MEERPGTEAPQASLTEAAESFSRYLEARLAKSRHSLKDTGLKTLKATCIALVAVGFLTATLVFVLYGAAQGLGELAGRPWIGHLAVGLIFFTASVIWIRSLTRKLKNQKQEFEDRVRKTREDLATAADPLAMTREHPYESAGVAAAAGFLAVVAGPGLAKTIAMGSEILATGIAPLVKTGVEEMLKKRQDS